MSHGIAIKLSSNVGGTITTNSTGDSFTTRLVPPIELGDSETWEVLPQSFTAWYTSPNISAANANNQFRYTIPAPNAGTYTYTIPDGLYTLTALQDTIAEQLTNLGHGSVAAPIISFDGLDGEQKVIMSFEASAAGYQVDFSIANTPRLLLGFDSGTYGALPGPGVSVGGEVHKAQNIANMSNGVEAYIVHTNIVTDSYVAGINGDGLQQLSLSLASPNTQATEINYLDNAGLRLSTSRITSITCYLTDQNGNYISLNNNSYNVSFMLRKKS